MQMVQANSRVMPSCTTSRWAATRVNRPTTTSRWAETRANRQAYELLQVHLGGFENQVGYRFFGELHSFIPYNACPSTSGPSSWTSSSSTLVAVPSTSFKPIRRTLQAQASAAEPALFIAEAARPTTPWRNWPNVYSRQWYGKHLRPLSDWPQGDPRYWVFPKCRHPWLLSSAKCAKCGATQPGDMDMGLSRIFIVIERKVGGLLTASEK